jgi:hypothetical protein
MNHIDSVNEGQFGIERERPEPRAEHSEEEINSHSPVLLSRRRRFTTSGPSHEWPPVVDACPKRRVAFPRVPKH